MKWPDAVPFDPSADTASAALEALLDNPGVAGPVVLLAVGSLARRSGWAAETAIALAEVCAARGENVILADLSLDDPELHTRLGVENEEGLSDVFLFGASLPHITQTAPGRTFRLIPASPFTPDAREILAHERWGSVFEEFAVSQSKLLVYLPADVDGAEMFSDRVGHTVVLADGAELDRVHAVLSEDAEAVAVLAVPGSVPEPEPEESEAEPDIPLEPETESDDVVTADEPVTMTRRTDADFEKIRIPRDGARDALIADLRARQRAALMAPPPSMAPLPEEGASLRPRPGEGAGGQPGPIFTIRAAHPLPRQPKRWLPVLLGLMLIAAAAAAGWYYWSLNRTGELITAAPMPGVAPAATAPAQPVPETRGTPLPFSVAIASYQSLDLAHEQLAQLQDDEPDLRFYIAPIVVQGALFYRVMAGPVADSTHAAALVDSLVERRIKTITSGRDVLATPLAFLLGEYTGPGAAQAQQQQVARKNIPSYIVEVKSPNGSTHYKLYAGAFTGPGDAEFMRSILKAAGLSDNLVERTGSIRT